MADPWVTDLLDVGHNRPGTRFTPTGLCLHSTADPGATAKNIRDYFQIHVGAQASAHIAVDWTGTVVMIPWAPGEAEVAWHAGKTANHLYLAIELCETTDASQFADAYARYLDAVRAVCNAYRWTIDPGHVTSHHAISLLYKETDHTDPDPYLERHGYSWVRLWDDLTGGLD